MRNVIGFGEVEYQFVIRDYLCAFCYSELMATHASERRWMVICPYHGNIELVGRVSRSWAEYVGQRGANEYLELRDIFDFLLPEGERRADREKQEPDVILDQLGY